jgi:hypothetical protein
VEFDEDTDTASFRTRNTICLGTTSITELIDLCREKVLKSMDAFVSRGKLWLLVLLYDISPQLHIVQLLDGENHSR